MATDTAPKSPPAIHGAGLNVRFLRKDITYLDGGTTVVVGTLPAGALIIKAASGVNISTAFNGNSTNTLDVGYSTDSGTDNLATLLALGTATFVPLDEVVGDNYVASETIISAKVVSTASASAGVGQIVIAFVENYQTQ